MQYENIPNYLKNNAKFCLWGYRNRNGNQTKVPYSPKNGSKARSDDERTFGSFSEALKAFSRSPGRYSGLGIGMFGTLIGIDIDNCINEDNELTPMAKNIVASLNSYTEVSPSGRGIHIICRAPSLHYDKDRYYIKNSRIGLEVYAAGITNRYLTLTGNVLNDEDVNDRKCEIGELLEKYMRRDANSVSTCGEHEDCGNAMLDDMGILDHMLSSSKGESIAALWNGDWTCYSSQSEADLALCNYLAFWTKGNAEQMDRLFRQSGLMRDKWDRAQAGSTYGAITIGRAIRGCKTVWTQGYRLAEDNGVQNALAFLKSVDAAHSPRYSKDDIGAGYLLADYLKPSARPTPKGKTWMTYDGTHWSDTMGDAVVEEAAKNLGRALAIYSATLPEGEVQDSLNWAGKWTQRAKRKQYIQDAASVYTVSRSAFDRDPWLYNLNNGTLDLRTMELRPHNPDDLITHISPVDYDPSAVCERWETFIGEIMEPGESEMILEDKQQTSKEKAEFLQRYLGYCLCGDTRAEAFLVMYGPTSRNGKSVCVETVQTIMGTYSKSVNADTLMLSRTRDGSGPSEDIARLSGIRMASVGEIQQGAKLDAARLKLLTGGDSVNARYLGENSFDFVPQFKLLLHTNHLPQCSDLSVFDSQRAQVLPFSRHFEPHEQDRGLKAEFRKSENQSGILNWLLRGFASYMEMGLAPPKAVLNATREYRKDSDKIMRFVEETLDPDSNGEERTVNLYDAYKNWCAENGQFAESNRNFLRGLERAGLRVEKARPKHSRGSATTLLRGYVFNCDYKTRYSTVA